MFRRDYALALLFTIPTIGLLSAGCSEDEKATPQAIFAEGSLTGGAGANCNDSQQLFNVGEFGAPALAQQSKPKKDGEAEGQGVVNVACSVKGAGNGAFAVDASVALSGPFGGRFTVRGTFNTQGEQTGIYALFSSRQSLNTYEQADSTCTVVYETGYQGVAAGRVWGRITCPNAALTGSGDRSCVAKATFRFENCEQ